MLNYNFNYNKNNNYYNDYFCNLSKFSYLLHNKKIYYGQKYKYIGLYNRYDIFNNTTNTNKYIYTNNILNSLYYNKNNSLKNFKYNEYLRTDNLKKGIYYYKYPINQRYFQKFYNKKEGLDSFNYLFYRDNLTNNKINLINKEIINLKNEYLKKTFENNIFKNKKLYFKDIYKYLKKDTNTYNKTEEKNKNNLIYNNFFEDSYFITKNLDYDFIFDKIKDMIFDELIFMCNIK